MVHQVEINIIHTYRVPIEAVDAQAAGDIGQVMTAEQVESNGEEIAITVGLACVDR